MAATDISFYYSEVSGKWPVPDGVKNKPVYEVLLDEGFQQHRDDVFKAHGVTSSMYKVTTAPAGLENHKVKSFLNTRSAIIFEPQDSRDCKLLYKQAEQFRKMDEGLKGVDSVMKKVQDDPKTRVSKLEVQVAKLKKQAAESKEQAAELKVQVHELQGKVDANQQVIDTQMASLAQLTEIVAVGIRKLLDACRKKAQDVLVAAEIPDIPSDWNQVISNKECLEVLKAAGLSEDALAATNKGKGSQQRRGDVDGARRLSETADFFAPLVCMKTGMERTQLLDCFKFYFS